MSRFSRSAPKRNRLFEIAFPAFAAAVFVWALIDRGPGAVAFDLAMHLLAAVAVAVLTCGAVFGLALGAALFAATFAVVWLRRRSFAEARRIAYGVASVTLYRSLKGASHLLP